jgi:hypothetical protein
VDDLLPKRAGFDHVSGCKTPLITLFDIDPGFGSVSATSKELPRAAEDDCEELENLPSREPRTRGL